MIKIAALLNIRSYALAAIVIAMSVITSVGLSTAAFAQDAPQEQAAPLPLPTVINSIRVVGNQRVEANTVGSYLLIAPGDRYSEERIDLSVKTLFATGLFADVRIDPNGGDLIIRVVENPIINRVILEGNKALK